MENFQKQVKTWKINQNIESVKANWQFTTPDALTELKRLYPILCMESRIPE